MEPLKYRVLENDTDTRVLIVDDAAGGLEVLMFLLSFDESMPDEDIFDRVCLIVESLKRSAFMAGCFAGTAKRAFFLVRLAYILVYLVFFRSDSASCVPIPSCCVVLSDGINERSHPEHGFPIREEAVLIGQSCPKRPEYLHRSDAVFLFGSCHGDSPFVRVRMKKC